MCRVGLRVRRSWQLLRWSALIALASALPAAAQTSVDLQLVLAVDASGSVDQYRFELQKRGYVAAFRHARVLNAIRVHPTTCTCSMGPVHCTMVTAIDWFAPERIALSTRAWRNAAT